MPKFTRIPQIHLRTLIDDPPSVPLLLIVDSGKMHWTRGLADNSRFTEIVRETRGSRKDYRDTRSL